MIVANAIYFLITVRTERVIYGFRSLARLVSNHESQSARTNRNTEVRSSDLRFMGSVLNTLLRITDTYLIFGERSR